MRLAGLVLALLWAGPALGCGAATDCLIELGGAERSYRIHLPPGGAEGKGAIVYHHGYRGSAAGAMKNAALTGLADALDVALIAAKSDGDDWQIPGVPSHPQADVTAPLAYSDAVVADAAARFGIDTGRLVATGFSAGGMMVWTLACHRGGAYYAGFVPIAGTFWAPVPESCSGQPANLIHIHGDADRIVPLAGRPIGPSRQGDVGQALAMYRAHGGFGAPVSERRGALRCETSENAAGTLLDFCLFEGGHSFRTEHLRMAWDRLDRSGAFD